MGADCADRPFIPVQWMLVIVWGVSLGCRWFLSSRYGHEFGDFNGRFLMNLWEMTRGHFRFPSMPGSMEHDEMLPVYLYYPVAALTRCDWEAIRAFHVLVFSLFPVFVAWTMHRMFSIVAGFAAGMFIATSRYFIISGLEVFRSRYALAMTLLLSAALLVFDHESSNGIGRHLLAGFLVAASFYVASHSAPMMLIIAAIILAGAIRRPSARTFRNILILGIVTGALLTPLLMYYADHPYIAAQKTDKQIWNRHDLEAHPEIILQQFRNVSGAVSVNAGELRKTAGQVPYLPLPFSILAACGLVILIIYYKNTYAYLISTCMIVYYIWIVAIEYKPYTGFYYEPFLLCAFLSAASVPQWIFEITTKRWQNRHSVNRSIRWLDTAAILLVISLSAVNVSIVASTRPRHDDSDLYREMYGIMEATPVLRNGEVWFDQHLWNQARQGEFHSFVFCLNKFSVEPRYIDYSADPPVEITGRESRIPLSLNEASPEYIFLAGHHAFVPEDVVRIFDNVQIVDTGNHITLCR
ncbi:MAG TPA: hypothetical protein PLV45_05405 [bacterium]|nr:hypothetical protein [bacterium]